MKIFYQNNFGQKIDFMSRQYKISSSDLLDYAWEYDSVNTTGVNGAKITKLYKEMSSHEITVSVWSYEALNRLHETAERDILAGMPGRFYINDQYLSCYIISGNKSYTEYMSGFLVTQISLVSDYPFWCREKKYQFSMNRVSEEADYPYDYPYGYRSYLEQDEVNNEHYGESPFRLCLYGPCTNPAVYIGGHLYKINADLTEGEYALIDSRLRTIKRVKKTGQEENLFSAREKRSDVFKPIAAGKNTVTWDGSFWFDLILVTERSEPVWSLS